MLIWYEILLAMLIWYKIWSKIIELHWVKQFFPVSVVNSIILLRKTIRYGCNNKFRIWNILFYFYQALTSSLFFKIPNHW